MSLSSHQSTKMKNDEWLTPPSIICALGDFDLDPCSPITRPWPTAANHYTKLDDGLLKPWFNRVWCNPPFGHLANSWIKRCREHGNAIALIPARTETRMFYENVWGHADAICFIKGRPHFHYVNGLRAKANSGAPICLVAYGENNAEILRKSKLGFVCSAK